MHVTTTAHVLAGIPCLLAVSHDVPVPRPVVLWCHGFRADALAHAAELERVAAAGFLAIGIDAVDHGARRDPQLAARVTASAEGARPVMLEVVRQTAQELPALIDELVQHHCADRERVSVVGISMGAFICYLAIARSLPVRAVVSLLGDPEWRDDDSPHRQLARFADVALLSVTAEHDVSVPPAPVRQFHRSLRHAFHSPRHHHHELRGAGHLTSAAAWDEAMVMTLDWLHRYGR